jgi:hypothetical protein
VPYSYEGQDVLHSFEMAAMSFLYPRIIEVHRSKNIAVPPSPIGSTGYSGREELVSYADPEGETVLIQSLAASIQARGIGRATGEQLLPGNVNKAPQWRIYTQPIAVGTIRDNDIIYDDEGYRYQVAMNYWTPMGYKLEVVRLET